MASVREQTPNSGHNHYWSLRRLEHIVKGHHQHNRQAVATKTDVKLKKKNQTKTKLWEGNTWLLGTKRAYKLMEEKGQRSALEWTARSLSFPLNWNAWMNEPMNEGRQRYNNNTIQHTSWTELFYHLDSISRCSRFSSIVCVCVCVANNYYHLLWSHTHRDPKTHI